jgi:hypothetical protein
MFHDGRSAEDVFQFLRQSPQSSSETLAMALADLRSQDGARSWVRRFVPSVSGWRLCEILAVRMASAVVVGTVSAISDGLLIVAPNMRIVVPPAVSLLGVRVGSSVIVTGTARAGTFVAESVRVSSGQP